MYVISKRTKKLIISHDGRERFFAYKLEHVDYGRNIQVEEDEWGKEVPEYVYKESGSLFHWTGDIIDDSDINDLPMFKLGRISKRLNKWYHIPINDNR